MYLHMAVNKSIMHMSPKSLRSDYVPSNTHLIITKKLRYQYALLKYNHFHKQKFNYDHACSRSTGIIASLPSSDCSDKDMNPIVDGADEKIPRFIPVSFERNLWAEDIFDDTKHHGHELVQEDYTGAIELLKERVINMLIDENNYTPRDKLVLIDTLERLGIEHHFEHEIEDQIKQISKHYLKSDLEDRDNIDLFTTALYFRIFRQHGYNVPCSVFDKFKDKDNKFRETIYNDMEGMLSLYEASFLRFHEETELQEARDFATHHLNKAKLHLEDSSYLKDKVNRALKQPLHWALPKVEAHYYISIYEKKESKDKTLLRLAKLDFHVMQNLFKKEMHEVQKWWYSFDLKSKLPYARDSVVLCYFWGFALSYEPKYSRSRIAAAKIAAFGLLLNDTYENLATLEEVQVLTDIMERLDVIDIDKLPNPKYMKILYKVLLRALDEFKHETSKHGRTYMVACFKEILRQTTSVYYKKLNWYKGRNERPTFQDYINYMPITSGLQQMLAVFYMYVESASSKAAFDWLASKPSAVIEAALYCRYMNDISTYKRERQVGNYPTSVDCYMEENAVSMQETKEKFVEFAEGCWFTLNKELIEINDDCVPKELLKPVTNFCRITFACYRHGLDLLSEPEGIADTINALLLDPVVM